MTQWVITGLRDGPGPSFSTGPIGATGAFMEGPPAKYKTLWCETNEAIGEPLAESWQWLGPAPLVTVKNVGKPIKLSGWHLQTVVKYPTAEAANKKAIELQMSDVQGELSVRVEELAD